ncbi:MAG: tetratricopeptide repeat protein [Candidatus Acidiferrales bacterium]
MRGITIGFLVFCAMANPCRAQRPTEQCAVDAGRDPDKAIQSCTKAIEAGNLSEYEFIHSLDSRGWAYYRTGDYDKALQDFNQAIQLKPDYAYAFNNRGLVYSKQGNYDRAIEDFNQAVLLKPDFAIAFDNRGLAYEGKNDIERAFRDFDQAAKLRPDDAEAFYLRGKLFADEGRYESAIKDFNRSLLLRPDDVDALKARSDAYDMRNDKQRAFRDINRAIELQPNDADAIFTRSFIYAEMGDHRRAIQDKDKVLQLKPGDAATLWFRGMDYYEEGDYDGAISDFNEVIRLEPEVNVDNSGEIYQRGFAHMYKGDYSSAIEDFGEVADLKLPWGFSQRGLARFFMGDYKGAIDDLQRAGEGPGSDIWMYLAWAKLGDGAKEQLQGIVPQNDEELKYWPGAVVQFYLGSVTSTDVLAAAKREDLMDKNPCACDNEGSGTSSLKNRTHYTEGAAYFYLGEDALLRGHSDEARAFFEKSIQLGYKNSDEYHGSVVELAHLAAGQTNHTHDTHGEVHHPN